MRRNGRMSGRNKGLSGTLCQLPPSLEQMRLELERRLGCPILVREIRTNDPDFRGRLRKRAGAIVLEYQVAQKGFFWHADVVEELLRRAAAGELSAELRQPR